jgi:hypothetical protein
VNHSYRKSVKRLIIIVGSAIVILLAVGLAQYEALSTFLLSLLNNLKEGK